MSRTIDILERLVGFPTVSADSNLDLIDYVQNLLQKAGFAVTRIPSPCRKKAGLFARIGPGHGGICLSAHTDVVPVERQDWSSPPFALTQREDRLVGRGTTDMKGFLASALALAEQAQHAPLTAPLTLSISYDEEIGCVGIRNMMPTLAPLLGRPSMVIVGEPTSMKVATGHKGKKALRVDCYGQSGHSALAPNFVNAIHVAASFVDQMRALQDELAKGPTDDAYDIPYSTVHIGRITGGTALNIVPDHAQIEIEFRHLADLPAASIRFKIDAAAAAICRAFGDPNAVKITEASAYFGLNTARENPVVDRALALAGTDQTTKVAFGTEAGFFADLGLNTVVMGPGDMATDGHKPNEAIALSQLGACDAMIARVLSNLG